MSERSRSGPSPQFVSLHNLLRGGLGHVPFSARWLHPDTRPESRPLVGAQPLRPDVSPLQRLEGEIANLMTEEKGALHDIRSAIIAKATAAVEIGRLLRIIKDEAL